MSACLKAVQFGIGVVEHISLQSHSRRANPMVWGCREFCLRTDDIDSNLHHRFTSEGVAPLVVVKGPQGGEL